MQCPVDGAELKMTERQGIEIDYCPTCRGVWLDRGELDKIIERTSAQMPAPDSAPPPQPRESQPHHHHGDDRHRGTYPYNKKRKSILGELFDF